MVVSRGAAIMSAAIAGVGAAASAAAGQMMQAAMQAAQIAADAAAAAMSALCGSDPGIPPAMGALMFGAPNVLIGGFPCPNLPNPLEMLMKGLKKLGKAIAASKAVGKLLKKVGLCNSPGEPINPFTGEVYNDFEDYHASDSGFVWERHYRSGWNTENGPLGHGFRHFYQRTLTLLRKRAIYETHDNEVMALERLPDGTFAPHDGFKLRGNGQQFQLTTDRDETLEFELEPHSTPPTARLTRYKTNKLDVYLFYDNANRLRALSEFSPGLTIDNYLVYGQSGYIEEIQRGVRGQQSQTIARYGYYDGCLVEWYDPLGAVTRFRYDAARRMVQGTDRRGYSFHWHYDPNTGRCIKSHGDDGLWSVEAKYEGTTSSFTEPDGGQWTFKHFPDGVVSHILDPLGGVKQYVRDDATGRITLQVQPDGVKVEWLYAPNGKLIHRKDQWGNLLPPEDEAPELPNPVAHDTPENQRDWLWGRPARKLAPQLSALPTAVRQTLNQLGPLLTNATPLAPVHDAMGRVVEQRYSDGSIARFQRDPEGNVVARQDTNGNWWQRHIISWNLLGAEKSPVGTVQQYAYNHREIRKTWVDGNGNRSDYSLDQCQRVTEMHHEGAGAVQFLRQPTGAIIERRDRAGKTIAVHEVGKHGLPTSTKLASGQTYSFEYNQFGNCTVASSDEHEISRQHLRQYFFQLIPYRTIEHRDGTGVRHGYTSSRNIEHTVYFERFAVEYRSLRSGRHRVFTPNGKQHDFYVTENGAFVRENGNGSVEVNIFDTADRLCARVCSRPDTDGGTPHWVTRYRYNVEGELLELTDTQSGPVRYGYDADHRLVSQSDSRGVREYAYDLAGNLAKTPEFPVVERLPGNLLSHTNFERFEYDEAARLKKRVSWDGRVTTYCYDSLGQLVEVRWSDTEFVWQAGYDGLRRRVWREYAGKRTEFYWDGDRLAAEIAPDRSVRVYVYVNTDALVPFMWLDYQSVDAEPSSGTGFYLFTNGTGMPLRVEDEQGSVVWQAKHIDAYGTVHVSDDAQVDLRLRFAGHFLDEHTGLFYNRFRDYEPALGRYLQPDPIDLAGGINLYAYPANPVVDVDLLGLVHKKKPESTYEPGKKPPHEDIPLHQQTPEQLKETCKFHADALADLQENVHAKPERERFRNQNTFSVGAVKGEDGKVRLVATMNDGKPSPKARDHMHENGIHDATDNPPRLGRRQKMENGEPVTNSKGKPVNETFNTETGQVHDKDARSDHHAEQRMERVPGKNEELLAQSPSQPCCDGCHSKLSTPNADGSRPIDKIPSDRQGGE
jgi:RHS repeat-associated protein